MYTERNLNLFLFLFTKSLCPWLLVNLSKAMLDVGRIFLPTIAKKKEPSPFHAEHYVNVVAKFELLTVKYFAKDL